MAEAVAIASIAATIVQLVQFSSTVLGRINEYYSTSKGIPKSFQPLHSQLPVLQECLKITKADINTGKVNDALSDALRPSVEGCRQQIESLDKLLDKHLPKLGDSRGRKGMKALLSIHEQTKLDRISSVIGGYVRTLTFYHTVAASSRHRDGRSRSPRYIHTFYTIWARR
jgi:hypothetical protein